MTFEPEIPRDILPELNRRLDGLDDQLFPHPGLSRNIFVIGAPRAGTTIVLQSLVAAFDVGYINNLAAAFWKAPAAGVCFAEKYSSKKVFSGQSEYGQTQHLSEPHEFGGFWRQKLGYQGMEQKNHAIDWLALERSLDQIAEAWQQRPMTYKVFQLAWHLAEFHRRRPETLWIWVSRGVEANVHSLLRLTEQRGHHWTSMVPSLAIRDFNQRPTWERVTAQVTLIEIWLREQLKKIAAQNQVHLALETFCQDPSLELQKLETFLNIPIDGTCLKELSERIQGTNTADISNDYPGIGELARQIRNDYATASN